MAFAYVSTRGHAPHLNFTGATLAGLAVDGGLYVPETMPKLSSADLADLPKESYFETAWRVMAPFIGGDIPSADLARIVKAAYKTFDKQDIAPLHEIEKDFYVLELFHGPTLAFKDVALQFLGHAFDYLLEKKKQRVTIVGATSGDTGSAAIAAFQGKANADIFILHPRGRVSEVQRRQMTTVLAPNVFNIAVEGSFDDCQDIVKGLFADAKLRADLHLSAVNSINWARILAQAVYYVYAGARVKAKTGKAPAFCVPTGNFGNIYAGHVAERMGAPVGRLIAATNRNDILHRFFATGRMKAEGVTPTLSPSMDIQVSSNFERLLFELFGRQGDAVDKTMRHFREKGPYHLEEPAMTQVRALFGSGRKDDAETLEVMGRVWREKKYLLDPHSAVGFGVAEDYRKAHPGEAVVTLATAHPAKFPDAVKQATGVSPPLPPHLADLFSRKEECAALPADVEKVKAFVKARARK
jgi:threonine synthase